MTRVSFKLLAIALVTLAISASAFGQTSKGFFVGNVTDQDGAVITGAAVKVTNAATGVTRVTTTNAEGSFALMPSIPEPTELKSASPDSRRLRAMA